MVHSEIEIFIILYKNQKYYIIIVWQISEELKRVCNLQSKVPTYHTKNNKMMKVKPNQKYYSNE